MLKNGHKKSCGCTRKEKFKAHVEKVLNENDLTGKEFTSLKVIKKYGTDKNNQVLWLCECVCGRTTIVSTNSLKSRNTKSCGCLVNIIYPEALMNDKALGTSLGQIKSSTINKNNTSGYRGVSWDKRKNKWRATIMFQGKYYHLGYTDDIETAIELRKLAKEKLFDGFLEWYNNFRE